MKEQFETYEKFSENLECLLERCISNAYHEGLNRSDVEEIEKDMKWAKKELKRLLIEYMVDGEMRTAEEHERIVNASKRKYPILPGGNSEEKSITENLEEELKALELIEKKIKYMEKICWGI